jgi:hypothetical protein
MPRAGFEPAIPVSERLKTVRALDSAAIGTILLIIQLKIYFHHFQFVNKVLEIKMYPTKNSVCFSWV